MKGPLLALLAVLFVPPLFVDDSAFADASTMRQSLFPTYRLSFQKNPGT